jgi:hypothetical protein
MLDSQKKQGSDDRREWAIPLTEIKDRFKDERRGDDWDHVGHQEVIYKVIRDFFDPLGIWGSGGTGNCELGRSGDAFVA